MLTRQSLTNKLAQIQVSYVDHRNLSKPRIEVACYKKKASKTLNTRYLLIGLPSAD